MCCKPKQSNLNHVSSKDIDVPITNNNKESSKSGKEYEKGSLKLIERLSIGTKPLEQKNKPFSLVDAGGIKEDYNQTFQSNQRTSTHPNTNIQEISMNISNLIQSGIQGKASSHLIFESKSSTLFKNKQPPFIINEFGFESNDDTRNKRTINNISFGLDESVAIKTQFDISMEIGVFNSEPKSLFNIIYERNNKNYILKSHTSDYFFSYIITPYHQIILNDQEKNYFKIGKIIIVITPNIKDHSLDLLIKKGESMTDKKEYTFAVNEFPVSIGRSGCTINLPCNSLSKSHSTLDYNISHHRFFFIDNASTNGSQLLLNKGRSIKISGDQMFNINDVLFTIKEIIK